MTSHDPPVIQCNCRQSVRSRIFYFDILLRLYRRKENNKNNKIIKEIIKIINKNNKSNKIIKEIVKIIKIINKNNKNNKIIKENNKIPRFFLTTCRTMHYHRRFLRQYCGQLSREALGG